MSIIGLLDILSTMAFLSALLLTIFISGRILKPQTKTYLAICSAIFVLVGITNVLQNTGITEYFEAYEDYIEILFFPVFIFFIYSRNFDHEFRLRELAEQNAKEALRVVENERAKSEAVIESMGDGISIQGHDFRVLYQNQVHKGLAGDHIGELCYEAYRGMESVCEDCPVEKTFADGGIYNVERSRQVDGRDIYVEIASSPVFDADGNVTAAVESVRNITQRREREIALRQSEERFRGAFESASVGASMAGLDGRFLKVNRFLCEMLGYTEEEMLGKTFSDVTHPEDVQIGLDSGKRLVSGETEHESFEKRYIRKDGQIVNVIISPALIRGRDGKPMHFIALFQDITERKRAEQALRENEEKFRNIFDSASDGIFILNMDGHFMDVNRTAHERLGYTKEEMLGMRVSDLDPPEYASKVPERINAIKEHGSAVFEAAHIRKDGSVMPVEVNARFMYLEGEKVMFSVIRDITERKQADEKIKASLREKEILLREVYHRVKNNLQVISSLQSLQEKFLEGKKERFILRENRNRIRAMALVHEKLYQSENLAEINLPEYYQTLINNIFSSYGIKRGLVTVDMDIEDISMDIDMLVPCGLITNELVTNSLKHAFDEGARGQIKVELKAGDGSYDLIVSDNGKGMPESVHIKGSDSLGLMLVESLTSQLQGEISIERGEGTRISVSFPMEAED